MSFYIDLFLSFISIIFAFVLVFLNGFFVAAEFAIVKVRRTRLEELAGQNIRAARISLLCVDQLDESLSATQLGITIVSLALGWIGETAFASLLVTAWPEYFPVDGNEHHIVAVAVSFFVITMLHVVLGELVPKSMAIQNAEKITLLVAAPLRFFYKIMFPLIWLFTKIANFILRMIGYGIAEEKALSEVELKMVMKESREEGVISENEAQIITRAFEFSDKPVTQIMVPRDNVSYLSLNRPFEENMAIVRKSMFTRYPLCRGDFDNVVGIVNVKDLWPHLLNNFSNEAFEKAARPAVFSESSVRQDRLMKVFQTRKAHIAIVRDATHNKNIGIVTLEDILEELVGEIRDEHD